MVEQCNIKTDIMLNRLRAAMPEALDGVLLSCPMHQSYICGFDFEDGYVALTRDRAWVFTDFRYMEAASAAVSSAFEVEETVSYSGICDILRGAGVKNLGFEDRYVTVADCARMRNVFGDIRLHGIGMLLENLRRTKTPDEIAKMKEAQRITDAAFTHILGFITPDRTETEVALELEFFMRHAGASGLSFPVIAISGSATAKPHGVPEPRKLERGFLTMDYGCIYQGYCSDMTRTVCIGQPDDEMKKIYQTVLDAQRIALENIGWHAERRTIDAMARKYIADNGYGKCFGHSLGHGVGRFIHESPSLSPAVPEGALLENGDVVTVEPGIYVAGRCGVRIEDVVIIHDNQAEDITHSDKHLIVL